MKFLIRLGLWVCLCGNAFAGTITGTILFQGDAIEASAVVYLMGIEEPDHLSEQEFQMVQRNQTFIPFNLPVYRGSTVVFPNEDDVFHSAFSTSEPNSFDLGIYGPGEKPSVQLHHAGVVEIFCNMHDDMNGYIHVLEHPFFSTTDRDGNYFLSEVPSGSYRIRAWANADHYMEKEVTVQDSQTVVVDFELEE